ncbi:MAG: ComF family protein [Bacteroidetes bacterium]|nr:MAG: ComF family protein [Bacteroidota bacterium]
MSYLYDLWDDFISLLFPRLCYACGDHLLRNEYLICTECYVVIPRTNYHNEPDNPVAQVFWGRCMIEKAAAFSFYNKGSRIRNLIHNLKYKGIKEVGYELGRIYGLSLKSSGFTNDIDLIVPVPLHSSKKRMRGFNQSEIISDGLAEVTGLPSDAESLIRTTGSATQTRRSRYERWTNVEGIFQVKDPEKIAGRHILLVDDVITTGSTIESCATELLKVEGVKVSVVSLAFAVV